MKISIGELDRIIAKLYVEFHEQNKDLFKTNAQEYARLSFKYVRDNKRERIEQHIKEKNKNITSASAVFSQMYF